MLFNSFQFLIFFPLVVFVYFIIPKKTRYLWLLASSYYFYMCWNAKYVLLLLFSTFITWLSGYFLEICENREWEEKKRKKIRKGWLVFNLFSNLGLLIFFKYFMFLADSINEVLDAFNLRMQLPSLDILLPVGISFFIFQALSYTMDVYQREILAEKNFLKYALFVSFFPQLVAGPIERSGNLLRQIETMEEIQVWNYERIRNGLLLMLFGFFQKLVIADRAALVVNQVFDHYQEYGFVELVTAAVLFSWQIYCDFGGYSNILKLRT